MHWLHTKCQNIVSQIDSLIIESQDIYGSIYAKLPVIEEEIYLTTKEVEILLDFFLHSESTAQDTVNSNEALHLSLVLKKVFEEVASASQNMAGEADFRRIMERFLAENNTSDVSIQALMQIIPVIKNKIADIELISMNAIIFASKLGDQGKAFEVISDNIMILSNRVANDYDGIEGNASELQNWNSQFTQSLDEIIHYHRRLTDEHLNKFQEMHIKVLDSLKTIRDLLYGSITSIQHSTTPVYTLMNLIQEQDIIQQSLENLMEILRYSRELNEIDGTEVEDDTQLLNRLSFSKQVLGLSANLITNVEERLTNSITEIRETTSEFEMQLHEMLEEGSLLVDIISRKREDQNNIIQNIFHDVDQFLILFNRELAAMSLETNDFKDTESSFIEQMRGIEDKIIEIKKSMNHLNKLNILSRIELARINNRESSSFVSEITNISATVIEDVHKNEQFIAKLRVQLEQDLSLFLQALSNNQSRVEEMQNIITSALGRIDMAKNLVIEAIQPIGYAGVGLLSEVRLILQKLAQGDAMLSQLRTIQKELLAMENKANEELEKTLASFSLTNWEPQHQDFDAILNRFTTYYERTVANNTFMDDVVDTGSDAGELTLF